jgi:ABC-type sugar transport system ATPase subunit
MSLLRMTGITKTFDGIHALRKACLEVERGEIHALVGENGAGKSTLMKTLAGVHPPDAGEIVFEDQPIRPQNYRDSVRAGIRMIFQESCLFENLTVAENLLFERLPRNRFGLLSRQELYGEAKSLLRRLDFPVAPEARVCDLSVGARQMIEIAKAVATGGRLVVMDEPTASLNGQESENLFALIRTLRDAGVSVIYISHRLDEVLRISDRLTVLRDGRTIACHKTEKTDQKEVIREMVGRGVDLSALRRARSENDWPVVLEVEKLEVPGKLHDVTFSMKAGEILGIAGLRGVGQDQLVGALFGLESGYTGSIKIAGIPRRFRSPAQAVACGIAYVTDDRKVKGLLLEKSSSYNSTLGSMEKISRMGFLQERLERQIVQRQTTQLAMAAKHASMPVKYLSGGNQQKVLLARALEQEPKILILNEPTAGIDVGAKEEIYSLLVKFASEGMAILLISSDLAELTVLSGRVLVLNQKRPAVLIPPELASDVSIIEAAVA